MTYALWIVQGLLAALFLFAGGVKLVMPIAELEKQAGMPGWFLRFIAVAEVLGAPSLTGRTSTVLVRANGMRPAMPMASSRSLTSISI